MNTLIKQRMEQFGYDSIKLASESFTDISLINNLIEGKVSVNDLDDFKLQMISSTLCCTPDFFTDENVRKNDIVNASYNRGVDTVKSNRVKVKLKGMVNNYLYAEKILTE